VGDMLFLCFEIYFCHLQPPVKDALDAFIYQRLEMAQRAVERQRAEGAAPTQDIHKMYPPELMRRL
jgi:hypothetical protein